MYKILILEDDSSLLDGLKFALEREGYCLNSAKTVKEAKEKFNSDDYSMLILDVTLPDGSGFDFCEYVRSMSSVPILFLTAMDEEVNIVRGLDIGGDDYITKPFRLEIFLSRVKALLRRTTSVETQHSVIESNGIVLKPMQCQVYKNGKLIDLTAAEYKLLCLLIQNPNIVLSKDIILERLWDSAGNYVDDNTLSVYIRRLRTKIEEDPDNPQIIVTVRRMGYKWSC